MCGRRGRARAGELVQGLRNLDDGFVPPIFDPAVLDRKFIVRRRSVHAPPLDGRRGFAGISSGAAVRGRSEDGGQDGRGRDRVLLPDGGWKYLSTHAWEEDLSGRSEGRGAAVVVSTCRLTDRSASSTRAWVG